MFSHVMLGANDLDASRSFYNATLAVLGYDEAVTDPKGRLFWINRSGVFAVTKPLDGEPATHGNGSTLGFAARSQQEVDDWHKAGLENGGTDCEDPPGVREGSTGDLYLAYLRDPSGNKICALYRIPAEK